MCIRDRTGVAEAIVDLCYNYVVEDSIYNVSKRYADEEFLNDFQKRLYEFWKEYSCLLYTSRCV